MRIKSFRDTIKKDDQEQVVVKVEYCTEVLYPNVAPRLVALQVLQSECMKSVTVEAVVAGLPMNVVQRIVDRITKQYDVQIHCELISGRIRVLATGEMCSLRSDNPYEAMLALVAELPLAQSEMSIFLKAIKETLFCDILSEPYSEQNEAAGRIEQVSVKGNIVKIVLCFSVETLEEVECRERTIKDRLRQMEICR